MYTIYYKRCKFLQCALHLWVFLVNLIFDLKKNHSTSVLGIQKKHTSDGRVFQNNTCSCWCTVWAEIFIRGPSGNVAWMMRIENDPSHTSMQVITQIWHYTLKWNKSYLCINWHFYNFDSGWNVSLFDYLYALKCLWTNTFKFYHNMNPANFILPSVRSPRPQTLPCYLRLFRRRSLTWKVCTAA